MSSLLDQCKQLSVSDWRKLRDKVDALHSVSPPVASTRQHSTHVQTGSDYLTGIIGELRRRRVVGKRRWMNPSAMFPDKLLASVDLAWKDILDEIGKDLTTAQQTTLATICAKALSTWLLDVNPNLKLGPKTMCLNAHNTLRALDHVFPGYAQAGVLAMVVRKYNGR